MIPVGTKSLLFGVHQFILHPILVFIAWWQLYGFPWDPRLWIAFVVHDLGYWGKPNMDGPEGETHPVFGADLMGRLFGIEWYRFCLYHSRFYAKQLGRPYSKLCVADKQVILLEPWWFYLPRAWASGELSEFMRIAKGRNGSKFDNLNPGEITPTIWYVNMQEYVREWVAEHKELKEDTWTPKGA